VNCFAISSSRDGYYGIVGEHCGILCSRKFVDIDGYLGPSRDISSHQLAYNFSMRDILGQFGVLVSKKPRHLESAFHKQFNFLTK
jgi:hypothetical protein